MQDKVTENSANLQDEEKPNPLVVVDGKIIAYDEMNQLDPNTIDNMSVFKGDKAKEYASELDLNISAEDVKEGLIVISLKKDFASLYAAGMADIAKADALDKEISGKKYDNQADYKADMQKVNNYYKSAMSALESAYALNPQHKPTVQSLYMIAFRLRDESGMMTKYEKYKSALQSL